MTVLTFHRPRSLAEIAPELEREALAEERAVILRGLELLTARERAVILHAYGFEPLELGGRPVTPRGQTPLPDKDVAAVLGVHHRTVLRRRRSALNKLRAFLEGWERPYNPRAKDRFPDERNPQQRAADDVAAEAQEAGEWIPSRAEWDNLSAVVDEEERPPAADPIRRRQRPTRTHLPGTDEEPRKEDRAPVSGPLEPVPAGLLGEGPELGDDPLSLEIKAGAMHTCVNRPHAQRDARRPSSSQRRPAECSQCFLESVSAYSDMAPWFTTEHPGDKRKRGGRAGAA